ncbi:MAG: hypothetical protein KF688_00370 [Pirellulales bacterium]|nr:hypothetical protein [Pirellulales bacterium]MBX3432875.1 hypothetical protein [Pirellulales bacterium]
MFAIVDDKYIPLYRIMWVAATPHFCGDEECQREGFYEVRLEQGESVWGTAAERDDVLRKLEEWHDGDDLPPGGEGDYRGADGSW